jgi:AraC family transcriptional regulator
MILAATIQHYAGGLKQRPHAHDEASVTLLLRGELRERSGHCEVSADPLSLVVKPAGTVHADQFGHEPAATCQILLAATAHDDRRWKDSLTSWRWIAGGAPVIAAVELARLVVGGGGRDAILDAAECVVDSLGVDRPPSSPPGYLSRAIEYIEDQLASGAACIRVRDAAMYAGVHPVHLSRVFCRHLGAPVTTWIRRRRTQRAAGALGTSRDSLSSIAAASGFSDQSHMNRVFRQSTGVLPATYREIAQTA